MGQLGRLVKLTSCGFGHREPASLSAGGVFKELFDLIAAVTHSPQLAIFFFIILS